MSPWLPVPRRRVTLHAGFWKTWCERIGQITIPHLLNQMRHQGQVDALALDPRLHRGRELADHWYWGGSVFWDSDLAKWLEAASYWLEHRNDPTLDAQVDDVIVRLTKAQQPDGYLNSHILTWRPNHRFKNLRDLHELYCAGHLIEAGVAHFEATGKRTLLDLVRRYADYLTTVFGKDKLPGYCGHPEVELALIRLYRLTGEQRYLDLCRFFIEERGQSPNYFEREAISRMDATPFRPNHPGSPYAYMQAHMPIREQTKLVGHAVRAMYLLCAVADLAIELGDESLREAAERLWTDAIATKLYLTGGLGSDAENEGFTRDYDLPNENAYAETCASIGLFLFAHRLLQFGPNRQYSDVMELALYNNILSGVGLDGRSFFYENPLASRGRHRRIGWPWWCPCCPPNLARLLSSISGYVFSESKNCFAVHHYINCETTISGHTVRLTTGLPFDGPTQLVFKSAFSNAPDDQHRSETTLFLRLPAWSARPTLTLNGDEQPVELENGYAKVSRAWQTNDRLEIDFDLPIRKQYARYEVQSDRGRLALSRGPLIYCLEEADNGKDLDTFVVSDQAEFAPVTDPNVLDGLPAVEGPALHESVCSTALYQSAPPTTEPARILAIPYFAWANRAPGEMQVWLRRGSAGADRCP